MLIRTVLFAICQCFAVKLKNKIYKSKVESKAQCSPELSENGRNIAGVYSRLFVLIHVAIWEVAMSGIAMELRTLSPFVQNSF